MILPAEDGQGCRRYRRWRARGFTLLEVILASLLMAMVLAALWEAFGVYTRLFESGGIQARRAQLVTALERQLTDDLQSAIEDSPRPNGPSAGSTAGSSGSVRRFGLQGAATTLRFDVLQTLPEDQIPSGQDAMSPSQLSTAKPQAPELKTIVYRFTGEPNSLSEFTRENATEGKSELPTDASVAAVGLSRWEIDFETPLERTPGQASAETAPLNKTNAFGASPGATSDGGFEYLATQSVADQTTTYLPEVRSAAFRYFDGQSWSDSWNSLQRGSLPVAVEVRLTLRDLTALDARQPSGSSLATDESKSPSSESSAEKDQAATTIEEGSPTEEEQPVYRFLILLPTARKRPERKPTSFNALVEEREPIAPPMDRLPRAQLPPERFPPRPPGDQAAENPESLPDQWLRVAP